MAMEDYLFPMQSLTTKAAMNPNANMMGLASSPFAVSPAAGGGGALMGLAGLMNQYGDMRQQQVQQQGLQSSMGQMQGGQAQTVGMDKGGSSAQDPLALLDANINRRFGI